MPETQCTAPTLMRHNEIVPLETMRKEATEAVTEKKLTLEQVGELIGKHKTTVHRALTDQEGRYADVVRDVIAAVTDYEVPDQPMYRYVRKGRPSTSTP